MNTQTKTRLQWIAHHLQAIDNCKRSGNDEWIAKHSESIGELLESAPSGSGFDAGTQIGPWSAARIIFETSFHHMNDAGMYDDWTEHNVIVTPAFNGFDIRVTGRNRNDIKDYIGEVFHHWLGEQITR